MADWVSNHRKSISFVIWMVVGVMLIVIGVFNGREPAMIALGAGAIGLPGVSSASSVNKE